MSLNLYSNEKNCDSDVSASLEQLFDVNGQIQTCRSVRLKRSFASLNCSNLEPLNISQLALRKNRFSSQQNMKLQIGGF